MLTPRQAAAEKDATDKIISLIGKWLKQVSLY